MHQTVVHNFYAQASLNGSVFRDFWGTVQTLLFPRQGSGVRMGWVLRRCRFWQKLVSACQSAKPTHTLERLNLRISNQAIDYLGLFALNFLAKFFSQLCQHIRYVTSLKKRNNLLNFHIHLSSVVNHMSSFLWVFCPTPTHHVQLGNLKHDS